MEETKRAPSVWFRPWRWSMPARIAAVVLIPLGYFLSFAPTIWMIHATDSLSVPALRPAINAAVVFYWPARQFRKHNSLGEVVFDWEWNTMNWLLEGFEPHWPLSRRISPRDASN